MRPPLSVTGTRWTRWTPLSNLSLANTPAPGDVGDDFLEAADVRGIHADRLDPPALLGRIALVHAEQVGGEQSRLVAPGPGADFEHRRAHVGGIARQQRDRERAFGLGQLVPDPRDFLFGQRAHLRIGIVDLFELGQLAAHRAHSPRPLWRPAPARHSRGWRRRRHRASSVPLRQPRFEFAQSGCAIWARRSSGNGHAPSASSRLVSTRTLL